MSRSRRWLWLVGVIAYAGFYIWYTDFGGPLTDEEINKYTTIMENSGASPERIASLRTFMQQDTGNQLIMINNLDQAEQPPMLPATGPNATAADLMDHYMEYMYPAQFARACHPIFFGQAVFSSMDLVGIEGAEQWDQAALFRYRSRRDLIDIATNPAFGDRHEYKLAALTKTIAYPVESILYYHDLRLMMALVLFSLISLIDLLIYRRS